MGSEAIRCVGCGTKNPRSNRFCGRCGTPLVGHGRQLDPFERHRVAILFADLSGFTANPVCGF
ncbi:MAG: zinc-ribbon domain-containing protein [Candidatus Bipolaricaulia bacterium]